MIQLAGFDFQFFIVVQHTKGSVHISKCRINSFSNINTQKITIQGQDVEHFYCLEIFPSPLRRQQKTQLSKDQYPEPDEEALWDVCILYRSS